MKMRPHIAMVAALLAAPLASAGTIVQSGAIAPMETDWEIDFQVDQFDDQGGTRILESVTIEIMGMLEVTARVENRDVSAAELDIQMDADISVDMGSDRLVSVHPSLTQGFEADPYDTVLDFGGPSGATFEDLIQTASDFEVRSRTIDNLDDWIGDGDITLTAIAEASALVIGGGNVTSIINTSAGVDWSVTYEFRGEAVPTPTGAGLAAAGLGGLMGLRRRR